MHHPYALLKQQSLNGLLLTVSNGHVVYNSIQGLNECQHAGGRAVDQRGLQLLAPSQLLQASPSSLMPTRCAHLRTDNQNLPHGCNYEMGTICPNAMQGACANAAWEYEDCVQSSKYKEPIPIIQLSVKLCCMPL